MGPQVKRYKTAFQFYQADHLGQLRKEITEMSVCMTELSSRWRALDDKDREVYLEKERVDRERYQREAAEADAAKLREQEESRNALLSLKEGETAASRQARGKVDEARKTKQDRLMQRQAELDPEELEYRNRLREEKREEAEERRRKRAAQEAAVAERHSKLDKDASKKAAQRLEYLLKQSDIFAKFHGGGSHGRLDDNINKSGKSNEKKSSSSKSKSHHRDDATIANDEDVEGEESTEEHVFLTKQPSCIAFGQLKGYQLEGLNWMIHLAEKGLNGILADEMGKFHRTFVRIPK